MNAKRKTLICAILVAVILVSVVAVAINQIVNRPEKITREAYDDALRDGIYTAVYLKRGKVVCEDQEGNRYTFRVEDALEFDEFTRDVITNFDIETGYYSDVDSTNQEES